MEHVSICGLEFSCAAGRLASICCTKSDSQCKLSRTKRVQRTRLAKYIVDGSPLDLYLWGLNVANVRGVVAAWVIRVMCDLRPCLEECRKTSKPTLIPLNVACVPNPIFKDLLGDRLVQFLSLVRTES